MPPIPCAHCGINFMRSNPDPEIPKICNNCLIKEQIRKPKPEEKLKTIKIIIECPQRIHAEIEETCMNLGINYTEFFLMCYKSSKEVVKEIVDIVEKEEEKEEQLISSHEPKKRGRPKK